MKKLLFTLLAGLFVCTASAQSWTVGGRIGSGLQFDAQYIFRNDNYVEGRFGTYWANEGGKLSVDFTALYNWHIADFDWTPSAGKWFFDAGAGLNVGGRSHYTYVGVAGTAKLGIAFRGAPVNLSFDWSPSFGPGIASWYGHSSTSFNTRGLCNFGITCVYRF